MIIGGYYMISSPCSNCFKKNQPKDICSQDCDILQSLQKFQMTIKEVEATSAIDYADEERFEIYNVESYRL